MGKRNDEFADHQIIKNKNSSRIKRNQFRNEILSVALLIIGYVTYASRSLLNTKSFGLWQDNEFYLGPIYSSMSAQFQNSNSPLFGSEFLGGMPFYGIAQFHPYYPFYFLYLNLFKNPTDTFNMLNFISHFHLAIFLINSYVLLRVLKLNQYISVTFAICMTFNFENQLVAGWSNIIAPYSWLPLVLASLISFFEKRSKLSQIGIVLSLTLLVYASPSQPLIHAVYLVLTLVIFETYSLRNDRLGFLKSIFIKNLRSILIIFALTLPVLLPLLVTSSKMIRWVGPYPTVIGNNKMSFEAYVIDQLPLKEIQNLFIRPVGENVHTNGQVFIGILVCSAVILGFKSIWKQKYGKYFLIVSLYSLISSFGENLGFAYINYHLPLIDKIREPTRFLQIFNLTIVVCAAIALDSIFKKNLPKLFAKFRNNAIKIQPILEIVILLLFSVIQFSIVNWNAPSFENSNYVREGYYKLDKVLKEVSEMDPAREFRIAFAGRIQDQNTSMYSSYFRMRTLPGYMSPAPYEQFEQMYLFNNRPSRYLENLGVKFLICKNCVKTDFSPFSNFIYYKSINGFEIYLNNNANPLLYFPEEIFFLDSPTMNSYYNFLDSTNQQKIALLDRKLQKKYVSAECKFQETEGYTISPAKIRVQIWCPENASIIFNQYYNQDWNFKINGENSNFDKANVNQMIIRLAKGQNTLEVDYKPRLFNFSLIVSVFILLLILIHRLMRLKVKIRKRF